MYQSPLAEDDPLRAISYEGDVITGKDLQRYKFSLGLTNEGASKVLYCRPQKLEQLFHFNDKPIPVEDINDLRPFLEKLLESSPPLPIPVRNVMKNGKSEVTFIGLEHDAVMSFYDVTNREYANFLGSNTRTVYSHIKNNNFIQEVEKIQSIGALIYLAHDFKHNNLSLYDPAPYEVRAMIKNGEPEKVKDFITEYRPECDWRSCLNVKKLERSKYITGNEIKKLRLSMGLSKSGFCKHITNLQDDAFLKTGNLSNLESAGEGRAVFSNFKYSGVMQDTLCGLFGSSTIYIMSPKPNNPNIELNFDARDSREVISSFDLNGSHIEKIFGVGRDTSLDYLSGRKKVGFEKGIQILGMLKTILHSFEEYKYTAPQEGTARFRLDDAMEAVKIEVQGCTSVESLERLVQIIDQEDGYPPILYDNTLECDQPKVEEFFYITENRALTR